MIPLDVRTIPAEALLGADLDLTVHDDGSLTVAPAAEALTQVVDQFSAALGRTPLLAVAG